MELINQPFSGQLGDRLIELMASQDYHTLNIVVAFAKNSGVLRIKDSLKRFRDRGGKVNAYVGVDLGGTSYEALTNLLLNTDSLKVIHSELSQTFHPKIYHFSGKEKGLLIVGSHNLTGGGLWTNFESSVLVSLDDSNPGASDTHGKFSEYLDDLAALKNSHQSIKDQGDIDKLLEHEYVFKEVSEQVRLARLSNSRGKRDHLFGKGFPAKLPRVAPKEKEATEVTVVTSKTKSVVDATKEDQTMWFETRSMTGGSRNILDLSMRSLVEHGDPKGTAFDLGEQKFMRGAVEFFGLDPTATKKKKNITLNFDGIDYSGNAILFPSGEKANGTWRLQIKGISPANKKITESFRAKGEANYLVNKVITFTKVQGDYYFLSVFPQEDIEGFKEVSKLMARNGVTRSAKLLGII